MIILYIYIYHVINNVSYCILQMLYIIVKSTRTTKKTRHINTLCRFSIYKDFKKEEV